MKSPIQKAVRAVIESLEARRLFSAFSLQFGTLLVQGDAAAPNRISLTLSHGNLRVVDNRHSQVFPLSSVTALDIIGSTKNDTITLGAGITLPTEIDGMGGNDHITGASQAGLIVTGPGKSVINPGMGDNYIDATLGDNVVNLPGGTNKARQPADTIIATASDRIHGRNRHTQVYAPGSAPDAPIMPWKNRGNPTLTAVAGETASGTVTVATLSDAVTLAGGKNPTGTLTLTLTAPDGSIADSETFAVSGPGDFATAHSVLATQIGAYTWHVSYSGDANNNPASDNGASQSLAVVKATPLLTQTPSETSGGVVGTSTLADSVTLAGGLSPGGQLVFTCTAPDGSIADTETLNVTGDGVYATSNLVLAQQAGDYTWSAGYSGDSLNSPVQAAAPAIPAIPPAPSATPPVLTPGSGFAGATIVAPIQGVGFAADATAIARWDVVPYQTFTSTFDVGVVAFHANGIARVAFSVNGGPWASVTQMSLNPQTNVTEYWATLDASKFAADGQIEVRAIVYPTLGLPRVLAGPQSPSGTNSLFLVANAHGAFSPAPLYVSASGSDTTGNGSAGSPFATIYKAAMALSASPHGAAGGTIYLLAGNYDFGGKPGYGYAYPNSAQGWLTISAAPGVDPSTVRITSSSDPSALKTQFTKLENLTVYNTSLAGDNGDAIWFDHCTLLGTGDTDDITFASYGNFSGGVYATNVFVQNVRGAFPSSLLARNVTINTIGEDSFDDPQLVINCTVTNITNPSTVDYHPDVVQYSAPPDNQIVFGLRATNVNAQGIFMRMNPGNAAGKDVAIVDVLISSVGSQPGYPLSQWMYSTKHLLFWNVTLTNETLVLRDDPNTACGPTVLTDLSIRDSVFYNFGEDHDYVAAGNVIDNNNFTVGGPWGTNSTTGDPLFTNPASDNFTPATGSPLLNRVTNVLVPVYADQQPVSSGGAIGALE